MPIHAQAFCFNEAGARYKVDPLLLRSIATVESNLSPSAIGKNRN
ncbi:transglycosylase SLT domain-containing protein, partial [Xenorhabdus bovienii]